VLSSYDRNVLLALDIDLLPVAQRAFDHFWCEVCGVVPIAQVNHQADAEYSVDKVRLPQIISFLNICQRGRNRFPYCVDSTHEIDDSTEQRNDYFQLAAGGL